MSDEPATNTTEETAAPMTNEPTAEAKPESTAEPKAESTAETPAPTPVEPEPEMVPEAEASIEQETAPAAAHEPEPEPIAPPELAEPEVAAQTATETPVAEPEPSEPEAEPSEAAQPEAPAKPKRPRKKATAAEDAAPTTAVTPSAPATGAEGENKKKWYAIKVQSGREESIKNAILRKVAIEGMEEYFGRIEIPVEEVVEKRQVKVKDKKTGEYTYQEKKVTKKKKKFHGYIFAELEFNDRILYLFRETSGVGDFLNMRSVKGQPPIPEPMPEHEVQSMLTGVSVKDPTKGGKAKVKIEFEKGDRVKIREGPFAGQEGEIKSVTEPKDPTEAPKLTVVATFWGRPVDVEVEYWQVEKV